MEASAVVILVLLLLPMIQVCSGGCSASPALCCPGRNDHCRRGPCFCDEACSLFRDCCFDYKVTCKHPSTSSVTTSLTAPTNGAKLATLSLIPNVVSKSPNTTPKDIQTVIAQMQVSILAPADMKTEDTEDAFYKLAFMIENNVRKKYSEIQSFRINKIVKKRGKNAFLEILKTTELVQACRVCTPPYLEVEKGN